ncbi:carbohydrate sulfotransferase 11-like [Styela clava]
MVKRSIVLLMFCAASSILIYGSFKKLSLNQENIPTKTRYFEYSSKVPEKKTIEQQLRQSTLERACRNLKLNKKKPLKNKEFMKLIRRTRLYFSDRYKLLACLIPKVGCTSFKKVLLMSESLTNETNPKKIKGVHDTANRLLLLSNLGDITEIKHRLLTYYKVMMVREPLHRVLSAYRDKFLGNMDPIFQKMANKIHSKFTNSHEQIDNSSQSISFEEFANFVSQMSSTKINNRHWEFYYRLCSPCIIKYDYIAKLETVDEDMDYIMDKVGMTNKSFPQNYPPQKRTNDKKVAEYFKNLPELKKSLIRKYKYDFELFGYSPKLK